MKRLPPKRIGLMRPFGSDNLGDAATMQAMIEHVRRYYPGAQVCGFSLIPAETQSRHGIPSFPTGFLPGAADRARRLYERSAGWLMRHPDSRPVRLVRKLLRITSELALLPRDLKNTRQIDLLIVTGSGQLIDNWHGAWGHPFILFKFTLLTRLQGGRVMFVSVGAGPIENRISKILIRCALALASYRSFRDDSSRRLMAQIGFRRNDPVYPDLAHSLPLAHLTPAQYPASGGLIVGVNPMSYCHPKYWPKPDHAVYEEYLKKFALIVSWVLAQGHAVLLYPGSVHGDRWAIDDLKSLLSGGRSPADTGRLLAPPITTVDQLMANLMMVDVVVATRFHGAVLPLSLCKPVLALSYHEKTDVLMADVGLGEYCLPIHSFGADQAIGLLDRLAHDAQAIGRKLTVKQKEYRVALDEQYARIFDNLRFGPSRRSLHNGRY